MTFVPLNFIIVLSLPLVLDIWSCGIKLPKKSTKDTPRGVGFAMESG